jgi:hypothetical protein
MNDRSERPITPEIGKSYQFPDARHQHFERGRRSYPSSIDTPYLCFVKIPQKQLAIEPSAGVTPSIFGLATAHAPCLTCLCPADRRRTAGASGRVLLCVCRCICSVSYFTVKHARKHCEILTLGCIYALKGGKIIMSDIDVVCACAVDTYLCL